MLRQPHADQRRKSEPGEPIKLSVPKASPRANRVHHGILARDRYSGVCHASSRLQVRPSPTARMHLPASFVLHYMADAKAAKVFFQWWFRGLRPDLKEGE